MSLALRKQHLIDPEICIRCNTCEATCPVGAVTHDDNNYVVDVDKCNFCMDCIPPCPTGSIDNWFTVAAPFGLGDQFSWLELPPKPDLPEPAIDALEGEASALLAEAHRGAGGATPPPRSAAKPRLNLFSRARPAIGTITGNLRITGAETASDVRHIIIDFGVTAFPVLEGQSIGITPPGHDATGRPHAMRLYSIASPRDGERPNTNNLAITVKRVREPSDDGTAFVGLASNYLCDLALGATLEVTGPFGATFLMPDDPAADLLMICTGTGAAPFRGFTERRRRLGVGQGGMTLYFGARTPAELPYFGPLQRLPDSLIRKELVYSRHPATPREYVQDRMRAQSAALAPLLGRDTLHLYVCGLRGLEAGVDAALTDIAAEAGFDWKTLRCAMLDQGRLHVETY